MVRVSLFILAALGVLLFFLSSCTTIPAGHGGVLFRPFSGGVDTSKVYEEGFHWIAPWNDMVQYDLRLQEREEAMDVLARNGLSIHLDVSFRFLPIAGELPKLHREIGADYMEKVVAPQIRSSVRKVIGKYLPEELYSTKREVIQEEIYHETDSNKIIQAQKEVLEEKNRDILDSITYAKRIQEALLPSSEKWQALLPGSFVLYLPRDIVAGDFYWLAETEEHIYVAVADATGHGVPGAFVSMICVTTLQKVIHEEGIASPASILMRSKELITAQLTQYDKRIRDGMDIALLQISRQNPLEITFSGANRPLWIYLPHEILEVPPTKQPIGYSEVTRPFEEHRITLNPSSMLYLFTDGMTDQMGGPKGRKLMQKGLREYLLSIAHLSPRQQGESLRSFFEAWRGDHLQMDDVTIIGIQVSEVLAVNPALS